MSAREAREEQEQAGEDEASHESLFRRVDTKKGSTLSREGDRCSELLMNHAVLVAASWGCAHPPSRETLGA